MIYRLKNGMQHPYTWSHPQMGVEKVFLLFLSDTNQIVNNLTDGRLIYSLSCFMVDG